MTICESLIAFCDKSFFQQLIATVIGVGLGFPLALLIDRSVRERAERDERNQLIHALTETINNNLRLVDAMDQKWTEYPIQSNRFYTPFFSIELFLLEASALKKYELSIRTECCQALDTALWELQELSEHLKMLRDQYHNANNPTPQYVNFYKDVASNCISLVKRLKDSLKSAKDELKLV